MSLVILPGRGQGARPNHGQCLWREVVLNVTIRHSSGSRTTHRTEYKMIQDQEFILIFANGDIDAMSWIEPYLLGATAVIAADGGIRHLMALGHLPDVLIGDLDSLPEGIAEQMDDFDMEIIRHPPAKDETDLELALLLAAGRHPSAVLVVAGGFGGRLDHTLANILLLAHPGLLSRQVSFVDDRESASLITHAAEIAGQPGDTVSLIPLGGPARVAQTTGLRWPLVDETLAFGPARGVSNEMTATRAMVRLLDGMVLCIHTSQ